MSDLKSGRDLAESPKQLLAIKRTRVEQLEEDAASHEGRVAVIRRDLLASRATSKKLAVIVERMTRLIDEATFRSKTVEALYADGKAALADYSKERGE